MNDSTYSIPKSHSNDKPMTFTEENLMFYQKDFMFHWKGEMYFFHRSVLICELTWSYMYQMKYIPNSLKFIYKLLFFNLLVKIINYNKFSVKHIYMYYYCIAIGKYQRRAISICCKLYSVLVLQFTVLQYI